jgi:hypothetical protein
MPSAKLASGEAFPLNALEAVMVLECYRVKPQFLEPGMHSHFLYVRAGELSTYVADPESCEPIGRTFHANRLQAGDVLRQGYCERKLTIEDAKKASILYRN